jgi:hypothetical protein
VRWGQRSNDYALCLLGLWDSPGERMLARSGSVRPVICPRTRRPPIPTPVRGTYKLNGRSSSTYCARTTIGLEDLPPTVGGPTSAPVRKASGFTRATGPLLTGTSPGSPRRYLQPWMRRGHLKGR